MPPQTTRRRVMMALRPFQTMAGNVQQTLMNASDAADEVTNAVGSNAGAGVRRQAWLRFVSRTKAAFAEAGQAVKALSDRVEDLEEIVYPGQRAADFLGFGAGTSDIRRAADALMAWANQNDVIQNPSSLAFAGVIRAYGEGQENQDVWYLFASLATAHAYYDPAVGLASIIQADGTTTTTATTGPTLAQLQAIYDEMLDDEEPTAAAVFAATVEEVYDLEIVTA